MALNWVPVTERLPEPLPGTSIYGREVLLRIEFRGGEAVRYATGKLNHYVVGEQAQGRAAGMPLWFVDGIASYGEATHWAEFNRVDEVAVLKDGAEG